MQEIKNHIIKTFKIQNKKKKEDYMIEKENKKKHY